MNDKSTNKPIKKGFVISMKEFLWAVLVLGTPLWLAVIALTVMHILQKDAGTIEACDQNFALVIPDESDGYGQLAVIVENYGQSGKVWAAKCLSGSWQKDHYETVSVEAKNAAIAHIPCRDFTLTEEIGIEYESRGKENRWVDAIGWVCRP